MIIEWQDAEGVFFARVGNRKLTVFRADWASLWEWRVVKSMRVLGTGSGFKTADEAKVAAEQFTLTSEV